MNTTQARVMVSILDHHSVFKQTDSNPFQASVIFHAKKNLIAPQTPLKQHTVHISDLFVKLWHSRLNLNDILALKHFYSI